MKEFDDAIEALKKIDLKPLSKKDSLLIANFIDVLDYIKIPAPIRKINRIVTDEDFDVLRCFIDDGTIQNRNDLIIACKLYFKGKGLSCNNKEISDWLAHHNFKP